MPVITIGGLQLGNLLTGAVVLETVMAIPGVGRLLVEAVQHRDQNVVLAATIVSAACFVGINILTDLSYAVVDRRVRLGGRN
jgi:peptide/nickel transport system permease protein